jgi:16S rRNA (cytosine967-C5)-methyltransferase
MTEKRPTLTLKPKAGGRNGGKKAGPARPGGPQAAQGTGPRNAKAGPGTAGGREKGREGPRDGAPRGPGSPPPRAKDSGARRAEPAPRDVGVDAGVAPPRPVEEPASPRLRHSHEVKAHVQLDYRPDLRDDALAFALLGAASSLARVRAGMALPQALADVFHAWDAPPQARGAMQDIAYRAMRQLGRSGTLLGLMTSKAPEPPMLAALLECALALLDPPEGTDPPYEAFTVVDQAVRAAAAHPDFAHAKAMVNAVLRRFLREREQVMASALREPVAQWNYPQWWIDAVRTAYPGDWQDILMAGNRQPPLTLRVNRRKTDVETYLKLLAAAGMRAAPVGPSAVRLAQAVGVTQIPGFADGLVSVQDAGAQLAAPLLDVHDGMRVLDACAAPGGKSGHILECADVDLTALDLDARRLVRVDQNLERLGLHATVKAGAAEATDWWDGGQYDRILADVPCTASGIVRRHPDIRWLRRKSDTHQLATLSGKILDNLWQMLRPNGKLLFVTCSLWPQESEAQAAAFAARHDAVRLDAPGQLLPRSGAGQDHDGLFYALFHKAGA